MKKKGRTKNQVIAEMLEARLGKAEMGVSKLERDNERDFSDREEKFRAISETAGDAIIMVDTEGRISYWNPAAERIFGYRKEEALGEELTLIIPMKYHHEYRRGLRTFITTGQSRAVNRTFESEAIKKDRTEIPVEFSISAIQLKDQWHAVGIVRDISHRKVLEESMLRCIEKYQILFENQKDAIMLVDFDTQRILEVNQAAAGLYGYSKEELLQMRTTELTGEPTGIASSTRRVINRTAQVLPISWHKKKDGTAFPAEISACAFKWNGRRSYCAVVRDASDQQCEEKRLPKPTKNLHFLVGNSRGNIVWHKRRVFNSQP
jgi:PAS domain S-box-containing protein